jgi:hypothetical protein
MICYRFLAQIFIFYYCEMIFRVTILTVLNPLGLVALRLYGVLDAGGAFDGIKESLGANNVAVYSTYK